MPDQVSVSNRVERDALKGKSNPGVGMGVIVAWPRECIKKECNGAMMFVISASITSMLHRW